jgi:hypothetical protein
MVFSREAADPVRYTWEPIFTFLVMVVLICIVGYFLVHFAEPYLFDTVIDLINRSYPFEIIR